MKIHLDHISKTYASDDLKSYKVLEDIDIHIHEGDFVIILGESGCGKSTLLKIMAGLLPPSSGAVSVNNRVIDRPDPSISLVFQQPSLLPWLNVEQNIAFGCKLRGDTDRLDYRVRQFVEIMGLSGFEKNRPQALSMGMAYRVSLARALVGRPSVFLLDEPFSSLDTFTRGRLQEELINIWLSEKFTAVFVTHDIDEAILLGRTVILLGGRPARIMDTIHIGMAYPRKITDELFFHTKTDILKKFKQILMPLG